MQVRHLARAPAWEWMTAIVDARSAEEVICRRYETGRAIRFVVFCAAAPAREGISHTANQCIAVYDYPNEMEKQCLPVVVVMSHMIHDLATITLLALLITSQAQTVKCDS
jgi:hypothetical protein